MSLIKRVAIVGPESTGKSDLSAALAAHYGSVWVPEFARYYLDILPRPYQAADLPVMARGQLAWENGLVRQAQQWLFCDTNLLVFKVWSEFKYGYLMEELVPLINLQAYHYHLLTDIDLPWQEDPQREHPHARKALLSHYQQSLAQAGVPFALVSGQGPERLQAALQALDDAGI